MSLLSSSISDGLSKHQYALFCLRPASREMRQSFTCFLQCSQSHGFLPTYSLFLIPHDLQVPPFIMETFFVLSLAFVHQLFFFFAKDTWDCSTLSSGIRERNLHGYLDISLPPPFSRFLFFHILSASGYSLPDEDKVKIF